METLKIRNGLFWGAVIFLFPALLINLDLLAMIDDEGLRSLVALEMKLSGNYIIPTVHGSFYYYKPPLYNWILLAFFELTGTINELVARIPTVLAVLGYGGTIYYFTRKYFDQKMAFLNAFVFITCGRILFWDSMLALIDITYSWVTFASFMVIFHFFQKGQFWKLFLWSYSLAGIGFMLKGVPSVLFQGLTLVAYFTYRRQFKKLFTWPNYVGAILFLLILGFYYGYYNQYNALEEPLAHLMGRATERTFVGQHILMTIKHLFSFPFEMIYHFLPWALFVVYFFRKGILQKVQENEFIAFNLVVFLANIPVYWVSPEIYPRYLLMLAPLIFSVYLYLHDWHKKNDTVHYKALYWLFAGVCALISIGSFALLFLERTQLNPYFLPKAIFLILLLGGLAYCYLKYKSEQLVILVVFLLGIRIAFNWFVLPDRNRNDYGDEVRISAKQVGRDFIGQKLFIYKNSEMQNTISFYLTNERRKIVTRQFEDFKNDAIYIIEPKEYPELEYEKVGELKLRHGRLIHDLGKLK